MYTYKDAIDSRLFFGGKINNLLKLIGKFNIPSGFIYDKINLEEIIDLNSKKKYIIRSSANIEDSDISTCAGLFNSKIIDGNCNFFNEIKDLYNSINFEAIRSFLNRIGYNKKIKLNFLVQEFIYGDFSGVYFSNYDGKELIEFIKGPNSLLVDGEVNASSIIALENKFNTIYYKQSFYLDKSNKKIYYGSIPKIDEEKIKIIFNECRKVKNLFPYDVDIEWTIILNKLYILQVRKIIK